MEEAIAILESQTYVAWNPCGCLGGAVVFDREQPSRTASAVAAFIRHGCTVELKPTEWVRSPECSLLACVDNPSCVRAPRKDRAQQEAMAL